MPKEVLTKAKGPAQGPGAAGGHAAGRRSWAERPYCIPGPAGPCWCPPLKGLVTHPLLQSLRALGLHCLHARALVYPADVKLRF